MSETIIDPELGEIPVILDTDTPEEIAKKEAIIEKKINQVSVEEN